jgi:hypothetical protein
MMLCITDSRFQRQLLEQAKEAGKIETGFEIPKDCRDNTPERIERALGPARAAGLIEPFPFGTDFTQTEQRLLPALTRLASASPIELAGFLLQGLGPRTTSADAQDCLCRMGLARPKGLRDWVYSCLLRGSLRG